LRLTVAVLWLEENPIGHEVTEVSEFFSAHGTDAIDGVIASVTR